MPLSSISHRKIKTKTIILKIWKTLRFVSTLNTKYRTILKIIQKYYNILKLDQHLAPCLLPKPQITFRKAHTIKNIIAPNKLEKPNRPISDIRTYFDSRTGIFQCRKRGCLTCQSITHGRSKIVTNQGTSFQIRQFITCSTECVVYSLRCPCNLLYVVYTMHTLRTSTKSIKKSLDNQCPTPFPPGTKTFDAWRFWQLRVSPRGL